MTGAAFLVHSAVPSGAELARVRCLRAMTSLRPSIVFAQPGDVVELAARSGIKTTVCAGPVEGLRLKRGHRSPVRLLLGVVELLRHGWKVGRWARDQGVPVLVATSVKSLLYGAVAARVARVPLVWSVHDRIERDYLGPAAPMIRLLGRWVAQAYVVNSRTTLRSVSTGGKPVLLSPPGLDLSEVRRQASSTTTDRSPLTIAMLGRLAPWKGQDVFIAAFHQAFPRSDVRATVVGGALFHEDGYAESLRVLAARGPAAARISFTGHVSEIGEHLARSSVLVHASRLPEPFGAVVVEGMAYGCAVIATTPGGPAEVITHGVDGLLVPCGDTDALASSMRRVVDDPALRSSLSAAGVARAQDYDVREVAANMEHFLRLVGSRRGRRVAAA